MVERAQVPDADRQEQLDPAGPEAARDPIEHARPGAEAAEADLIEQLTPAGREPAANALPPDGRVRHEPIPEADALEQAQAADREVFEDDE